MHKNIKIAILGQKKLFHSIIYDINFLYLQKTRYVPKVGSLHSLEVQVEVHVCKNQFVFHNYFLF